MKTFLFRNGLFRVALIMGIILYVSSCKKGGEIDEEHNFHQLDTTGGTGPYNINVLLFGNTTGHHFDDQGLGYVKFRQKDSLHNISLETWVFHLAPHHTYLLQRAVNPITDNTCSSTSWLTLGLGLTPQAIHTDKHGFAYEPLFRNVAAIPSGTQFRIHFQIVDSASKEPVLTSDCYSYTVK